MSPAIGVVPPIEDDAASPPTATAGEAMAYLASRALLVPVAGVEPHRLRDSFAAGRDGGARQHNAIDIMAPHGTPILAADDGRVIRMSRSALGGITVYTTDPHGRLVYYYAHMDGYHERLAEGMAIQRGDTLGFVGSTGNARANEPHLHFQVMRMPEDRRRYWDGEPINPFEVLVAAGVANATPVTQAGDERP